MKANSIPLTQGQVATVDDDDYTELSQFKWWASYDPGTRSYYAVRKMRLPNGKRTATCMHRQILGLQRGDKRQVDHWNHDTLDNRRVNLRIATRTQNNANMRRPSRNRSGFKGSVGTKTVKNGKPKSDKMGKVASLAFTTRPRPRTRPTVKLLAGCPENLRDSSFARLRRKRLAA